MTTGPGIDPHGWFHPVHIFGWNNTLVWYAPAVAVVLFVILAVLDVSPPDKDAGALHD